MLNWDQHCRALFAGKTVTRCTNPREFQDPHDPYTGYAGWHVTAGIPVKFGTAHGRSRPEVGSTKRIDANGEKGVPPAPRNFGTFEQKMITPTACILGIKTQLLLAYCW